MKNNHSVVSRLCILMPRARLRNEMRGVTMSLNPESVQSVSSIIIVFHGLSSSHFVLNIV